MNRELKFRVWDNEQKKFEYFELNNITVPDRLLTQDKFPVQQFTGLKDYESNDIYEGDIVRYELDGTVYTQTVGWGNNGWEMIDTRLYSTPLITNLPNFEVVGNIFENSELLNK